MSDNQHPDDQNADNAQRWHNQAMQWRAAHAEQAQAIIHLTELVHQAALAQAAQACRARAKQCDRLAPEHPAYAEGWRAAANEAWACAEAIEALARKETQP